MSLTATLTLLLPLLRTAVSAGCSGVGVVIEILSSWAKARGSRLRRAGVPRAMPSSFIAPATAATASCISAGPIAPMQPTRNVSTWVSLPG